MIFDELSLSGAEVFITPLLLSSLQSLSESLEVRNELIKEWKQAKLEQHDFAAMYFGVPQGNIVDERYRGAVDAIYSMTDDVIAFSMMLGESLQIYAQKKHDVYDRMFRGGAPKVNKFDFSKAESYLPEVNEDHKHFAKMLETGRADQRTPLRMHQRLWRKFRPRNQPHSDK